MGLGEPRKRVKYSIDPNALSWANDDGKFGKKLMQKMGWEEGKGLGAKETGITENLKVKFKGDSKGIGYNNNDYDNVWLDHQDDYEKLLKDLGKSNDHQAVATKTTEQVQTLELNSKSSKARLHYKKFTKSKDLSNASLTDLNCILGKEKRQKIAAFQNNMESVIEKTDVQKKDVDETNGGLFSTNKLSVSDYFASKMAAKLNKNGVINSDASSLSSNILDDEILKEKSENADEDRESFKITKKKRSKNVEIINEKEAEETQILEEEVSKKKKRKKESTQNEVTSPKECVDETTDKIEAEKLDSKNFNGSSLFNIYGYSPYHINASFKEVLNYKIKKSNKKRELTEKILAKNEKFYEMNKKKSC